MPIAFVTIGLVAAAFSPVRLDAEFSILPVAGPRASFLPMDAVARNHQAPHYARAVLKSQVKRKVDVDKIVAEAKEKAELAAKKAEAAAEAFKTSAAHNNGSWTAETIVAETKKKTETAKKQAKKLATAAKKAAEDAIADAHDSVDKRDYPEACQVVGVCFDPRSETAEEAADDAESSAKNIAVVASNAAKDAIGDAQDAVADKRSP